MIYSVYLINIWKFREKPRNKTILRKCHIGIIWYWVHIHISIFQGILCYTVICWKSQIGFLNRNSNVAIWLTANSWKYFKMTFVKKICKKFQYLLKTIFEKNTCNICFKSYFCSIWIKFNQHFLSSSSIKYVMIDIIPTQFFN